MLKARLGLALYLNPQSDRARFLIAQALSEINQKQSAKEHLAAIDQHWGMESTASTFGS